jgi:hypothetical protein
VLTTHLNCGSFTPSDPQESPRGRLMRVITRLAGSLSQKFLRKLQNTISPVKVTMKVEKWARNLFFFPKLIFKFYSQKILFTETTPFTEVTDLILTLHEEGAAIFVSFIYLFVVLWLELKRTA